MPKNHIVKFVVTKSQKEMLRANAEAGGHTSLKAKYPIKAKTIKSAVYEYYNPEVKAVAAPVEVEVK